MKTVRFAWGLSLMTSLAAGCRGREVTAVGTTVLSWNHGASTSLSELKLGKDVGEPATLDKTLKVVSSTPAGQIAFKLHVVTGMVESVTESPAISPMLKIPRTIEATVEDNADRWAVRGSCESKGPFVAVPSGGSATYSNVLFQRCALTLGQGDKLREVVLLEISGEGTIKPTFLAGTATLE